MFKITRIGRSVYGLSLLWDWYRDVCVIMLVSASVGASVVNIVGICNINWYLSDLLSTCSCNVNWYIECAKRCDIA